MSTSKTPIDDYAAQFPEDVQLILLKIRDIVLDIAPDIDQVIKYGIPTCVLKENLVHFAGYKKHIGFYPTPSGIKAFEDELADYAYAKGSVKFPLNKPIPYDLIEKIVRFRLSEIQSQP